MPARKLTELEEKRLNPYALFLTDPLWALEERRALLTDKFQTGSIDPIIVLPAKEIFFPDFNVFLVFNGNKRTVLSREFGKAVPAYIIRNGEELLMAQTAEPRAFQPDFILNYESVQAHLEERAKRFLSLNRRVSPIKLEQGIRQAFY